jgi:hypothetical protein
MAEETSPRRLCGSMSATIRYLELNPGMRRTQLNLEAATRARRSAGIVVQRGLLRIPVIVHVLHKTDEENVSDAQIESQLDVLNQDFRATNSDLAGVPAVWRALATDAQLEFHLADVTRTRTNQEIFTDNDGMKFESTGGHDVVDPERNLNIWVCNLEPWLGYAYFPGVAPEIDGVVIRHTAFGTEGTAAHPFDLGRTTTHEIGHYLNLYHIWGGDTPTCSDTDFVEDTPNQEGPNYHDPTFPKISCGNGPSGDMFMNYMDYVNDAFMFMFTAQQVLRMRTALAQARPLLGTTQ